MKFLTNLKDKIVSGAIAVWDFLTEKLWPATVKIVATAGAIVLAVTLLKVLAAVTTPIAMFIAGLVVTILTYALIALGVMSILLILLELVGIYRPELA